MNLAELAGAIPICLAGILFYILRWYISKDDDKWPERHQGTNT